MAAPVLDALELCDAADEAGNDTAFRVAHAAAED
jgi:hypothetical protein